MKPITSFISLFAILLLFTACSSTKVSKVSCPTFKSTASKSFKKSKQLSYKKKTKPKRVESKQVLTIKPAKQQYARSVQNGIAVINSIPSNKIESGFRTQLIIPKAPSAKIKTSTSSLINTEESQKQSIIKNNKIEKKQKRIQKKVAKKIEKYQKKSAKKGEDETTILGVIGCILGGIGWLLFLIFEFQFLFTFILMGVFFLLSMILGIIALKKIKKAPSTNKGKGFAIVATLLGIISFSIFAVASISLIFFF